MKKLWNSISKNGKYSVIGEFFIPVLTIIACIILLVFNFSGVISLTQSNLLNIAIILLTVLVATNLIERFSILSSIFEKLVANI